MKFPVKRYFLVGMVFLLISCQGKESSQKPSNVQQNNFETPKSLGEWIQQSALILTGRVEKIENFKNRKDWYVITLKPDQIIKGNSEGPVKILDTKLFPNEPSFFNVDEKVLVFLNPLPSYTAWQEVIKSGVKYGVLGAKAGIVKTEPDLSMFAGFSGQVLAIEKIQDSNLKKQKFQELYETLLQKNPPGRMAEEISRAYFQIFPASSLTSKQREFFGGRVKDPNFSSQAKEEIVKNIAAASSAESHQFLQEVFCYLPSAVCLLAAETLESRGIKPSLEIYQKSIEEGPEDLRLGLFVILARHQRSDSFLLFEKYLKLEKEEKKASTLVEALGDFGTPQAENLVLSYAKDPRYFVRLAVATSLGKLKSTKGIPVLEEYLKTQDPAVITVTAQALKQIGTKQALDTLGKYYQMGHHGHWEPAEPEHFNLPQASP